VFVRDPQSEWRKHFAEKRVKVSKVISISKLKGEHKAYEQKRILAHSYDLFLVDDRIYGYMPRLLGKEFYKKKRFSPLLCVRCAPWC
jgi:ribosome biogenesis protein UTP30